MYFNLVILDDSVVLLLSVLTCKTVLYQFVSEGTIWTCPQAQHHWFCQRNSAV